jgi:UPF0271 protein
VSAGITGVLAIAVPGARLAPMLLNIDLGELSGEPDELYALADIANIACGGHAGDDTSMDRAIELCRRFGTRLGAHPSYPDRPGFGRKRLAMPAAVLRDTVAAQCASLAARARAVGERITYVKAHGALYHAAREDRAIAEALLDGVSASLGGALTVLGPAGGALAALASGKGLPYAREGFADRATRADGTLVPRGEPGAVIEDPRLAAERARALSESQGCETVCVHGDTSGAVEIARAVRGALGKRGT